MDKKNDIREMLKKALRKEILNENKKTTHDFGCIMVFLKFDKKVWDGLQALIDDDDLYIDKDDDSYGLEQEPHITILYGLHEEIKDEDIEKDIDKIKEPGISLGKVSSFNPGNYDVLKFDIKSPGLHKLNKIFTEYPHTNSFPDYHPHTTISYIKPGLDKKYIKLLNDYIEENGDIEIKPGKIVYSKVDGSKKEYKFAK